MKHETLTPEQDARMSRINHLGVPIVNANEPLIPHDHPFFKERTADDNRRKVVFPDHEPRVDNSTFMVHPKGYNVPALHGYALRSQNRRAAYDMTLLEAV